MKYVYTHFKSDVKDEKMYKKNETLIRGGKC